MKKYFNSLNTRQKIFASLILVVFISQFFTMILACASIMKCSYSLDNQAESLSKLAQDNTEILLGKQNKELLVKSANGMADSAELLLKQAENRVSELCYSIESAYITNNDNAVQGEESKVIGYAIDNQSVSKGTDDFLIYKSSRMPSDNIYSTKLSDWNTLTKDERSEILEDKVAVSESEMPQDIGKEFNVLGGTLHTIQSIGANNENISKIYVATNTGILYGHGIKDKEKIFDARTKTWYKDAINEAKNGEKSGVWQRHISYYDNGEPYIICSKAYFNSSGAIKGVVALELYADKLFKQTSKVMMNDDKYIFAFDNVEGNLVEKTIGEDAFWDGFDEPSESYDNLIKSLKNNECETIDIISSDGNGYIVSYAPVESIGCSVGIAEKSSTAFGDGESIKNGLLHEIERCRKNSGADTSTVLFQFFIILGAFSVVLYALCGVLANRIFPNVESDKKDAEKFRKLNAELEMAEKVQKSMLPKISPFDLGRDDLEIYASNVSAEKVGGDFYDFFFLKDGRLALVIADASDKGVPAALFMSAAKKLIKTHIQGSESLADGIEAVNDSLYDNNDMRMFVTAFVGILDLHNGNMEYINAGHNPPLFYSSKRCNFEFLGEPHNCALGGIKGKKYAVGTKKIYNRDALLLYTDGVTESFDSERRLFTQERLREFVNRAEIKNLPMKKLAREIQKEIQDFSREGKYKDDVTILGFRNLNGFK